MGGRITRDAHASVGVSGFFRSDYVSRELLESLLKDTEKDHTYWLEQQLRLVEKTGLQNYLQSQMS